MQLHTIFDDTSALDTYLHVRDAGHMELLLLVAALVVFDVLAARYGFDSRVLNPRDARGWWADTRGAKGPLVTRPKGQAKNSPSGGRAHTRAERILAT